jgi:hypothetical protein
MASAQISTSQHPGNSCFGLELSAAVHQRRALSAPIPIFNLSFRHRRLRSDVRDSASKAHPCPCLLGPRPGPTTCFLSPVHRTGALLPQSFPAQPDPLCLSPTADHGHGSHRTRRIRARVTRLRHRRRLSCRTRERVRAPPRRTQLRRARGAGRAAQGAPHRAPRRSHGVLMRACRRASGRSARHRI